MIADGMPLEKVSKMTGISQELIKKLNLNRQ